MALYVITHVYQLKVFVLLAIAALLLLLFLQYRGILIQPLTTSEVLHFGLQQRDIIYDQYKLASAIKHIHDLHYNVPTGEKCIKRRPQCIVIGVKKCGTTELVDFMALHPNIVIKGQQETKLHPLNNNSVDRLIQEMPCSFHDQITVFKNSGFFHEMQPKDLHKYNKTLKMIVLVREPVSRLISDQQYSYFFARGDNRIKKQNISSMPSIDGKLIHPKTGKVKTNTMTNKSIYDEPLSRYLKYFTLDNMLFIESSELIKNPARVLHKVETFLGLKHIIDERDFVFNEEKNFYCIRSYHEQMVCYGTNRGRSEFKDIRSETRAKLKTYYKQHNENFFKLIGSRYDW